jgi:hypothetical protein
MSPRVAPTSGWDLWQPNVRLLATLALPPRRVAPILSGCDLHYAPTMPRNCVFCGAPADSQEHVWPNWAGPMLADEGPLPHFHQVIQEGRAGEERRYSKDAYSVTVGVICKGCNNGWMSDLESRAKPCLETMLQGHGRALHETGLRTLATWALKTSMMVEHTHGAKRNVIPGGEYAYLFEHREPSERVRVWMAAYAGTQAVALGSMWGLDAETNETGPREWEPDRGARDIWGATILFGPVVFQVFGTTLLPLLEGLEVNAPYTHRIWPYTGGFTWVPRPGFNDHELRAFADILVNEFPRRVPTGS